MRSRTLPIALGIIVIVLIIAGLLYSRRFGTEVTPPADTQAPPVAESETLAPPSEDGVTASTGGAQQKETNMNPDLSVDANGLSKATVIIETTQGTIKYKFYPKDAPNTVSRMVELINQGFYDGLTFHRTVPGFVIQGGDPVGNGTGGSGQKLKAEFNNRPHIEGTVAMARAADPDSADSQFYISLGTHPHLDRSYTVFGQVIEGMDVARKIRVGDKMTSVRIE